MKAEYKLKKERWKREMESQETPKSQRNQGNVAVQLTINSGCIVYVIAGKMVLIFLILVLFCCIIVMGLVLSGSIKADIEISVTFHGRVKFVSEYLFGDL